MYQGFQKKELRSAREKGRNQDEINFINNHSLKGRDKSKMTGCYMNNKVLKRNGDSFTLKRVTNKYFELRLQVYVLYTFYDVYLLVTSI